MVNTEVNNAPTVEFMFQQIMAAVQKSVSSDSHVLRVYEH